MLIILSLSMLFPTINDKLITVDKEIEGIYYCFTDKAEYAATIKKANDVYIFQWSTGAEGIGIREGDRVSVSWSEGKISGITIYRIRGEVLTGRGVVIPGNGLLGSEEMRLIRRFKKD